MWGVLIDYSDCSDMTFKLFDDEQDAIGYADDMACEGFYSTIFKYDKDSKQYLQMY